MVWLALIVLGVLFFQHREQLGELKQVVDRLQNELRELRRQLVEARATGRTEPDTERSSPTPPPVPAPPPSIARVVPPAPRQPAPLAPLYVPRRRVADEQPPANPLPPNKPTEPIEITPEMLSAVEAGAEWKEVARTGGESIPPSPPLPPPPPRSGRGGAGGRGGFELPSIDWENFIGVKLFSWIAGIALALAGVFFLRYSIDHGWLSPTIRMSIGILVGISLLGGSELPAARRYGITVNALTGAGIAILFSTFFAAHALWKLMPATATFALMVLVTATAVLLSIRRGSIFIALLGLLGGFATPALVSTGQNNPIGLFGYLLVLNAGLAWVAHRKRWPLLTALSLLFTTVYQWGWVMKFLTAGSVPLAVGVFLVFPVLSFAAVILGRRNDGADKAAEAPGRWEQIFTQAARAGALIPLTFAVYLAAVPAYGTRWAILFGFLALVDLGLFAIALTGPKLLHLVGAATTVVVWAVWLNASYVADAWPWALGLTALFVGLYLVAPLAADRLRRPLDGHSARAVFAAPLLLFTVPALITLEPRAASPWLPFATLLMLAAGCSVYAIHRRQGWTHHVAAFFALAAEAVWSIKYLSPAWLIPGLVVYATLGLFYVATPAIARRLGRPLAPQGAAGVGVLVAIALLFFLATGQIAQVSLWGLAILLVIMNLGVFAESAWGRLPELSLVGVALSWLVLGIWWLSAGVLVTAALLLPALTVIAGFALLVLAGNLWARKQIAAAGQAVSEFERGTYLGLTGHLFLLVVAANAALSVPPWPMFGVLTVLNLAIGTAALYLRRGEMHLAAIGASALLLMVWVNVVEVTPWPTVATFAAGALCALAIGWMFLARRVGATMFTFEAAAVGAPLLAAIVTVMAGNAATAPALALLISAHLVFIGAALALATMSPWQAAAIAAAVPAAVAVFRWQMLHPEPAAWTSHLLFAAPIYAAFLAYPLLLGRRVGRSVEPYVAAVLASAAFFFQARRAMILGGYGSMIGALPVVQAALVATHLAQLVRMERGTAQRALGRLALVAGAALAFVTVAIPLQLERQWITVGWALEAMALAWLYGRIPHRGLLIATAALFTVVFVRLAANPSVLTYEPRGAIRIWNWYLYAYLIAAAAMLAGSRLLARTRDTLTDGIPRLSSILAGGGVVLLFLLLNIEIADFYATGPTITFNFTATLAQDLTYTLGWAIFAVGLLAAGIALKNRPGRIAAITLLAVTVFKAFLHDLARLGGLYRVGSFVGLAVCLALVALALQKFALTPKPKEAA